MPLGALFGTLFFVLLGVAALTSAMSLLEVVVSFLVDEKGLGRRKAVWAAGTAIFLLGIPSSLSLGVWSGYTIAGKGFFDVADYLASNILLPSGGIFISIFAGWVVFPKIMDEENGGIGKGFRWAIFWRFVCRYVAPAAIAVVLISGL